MRTNVIKGMRACAVSIINYERMQVCAHARVRMRVIIKSQIHMQFIS